MLTTFCSLLLFYPGIGSIIGTKSSSSDLIDSNFLVRGKIKSHSHDISEVKRRLERPKKLLNIMLSILSSEN